MLPVRERNSTRGAKADDGIDRVLPEPLVDETGRPSRDSIIIGLKWQSKAQFKPYAKFFQVVTDAGCNSPMDTIILTDTFEDQSNIISLTHTILAKRPTSFI